MQIELPLKCKTSPDWVALVLKDSLAFLSDHAHLEKKAASNAMELLPRFPWQPVPADWSRKLVAIACDETSHLKQVVKLLHKRGGNLNNFHRNPYAGGLHKLIRQGQGTLELVDRLLISALIEGRSCERFAMLADPELNKDQELRRFYKALAYSEIGHFRIFQDLAEMIDESESKRRWNKLLEQEADTIQNQPLGDTARMHSWV